MNRTYSKNGDPNKVAIVREYILANQLSETDTILLNPIDFDELAHDYWEFYNEHLPEPYLLLGVLIKEDSGGIVPVGGVGVLENDTESIRTKVPDDSFDPDEIIFRCGWCGNAVDYDGVEFDPETRLSKIKWYNKVGGRLRERAVNGYCCKEKWS